MAARVSAAVLSALRLFSKGYTLRQAAMIAGVHRRSLERAIARAKLAAGSGRPTQQAQADTEVRHR